MSCILIVDDEPNNRRILTYTLHKAGYHPLVANSGASALELIDQSQPDLAILDVAMPLMDGITLLTHIRAIPKYEHLPVIILTGSGDDLERERAERVGIQSYLTKPAGSKMILETVGKLLKQHAKN